MTNNEEKRNIRIQALEALYEMEFQDKKNPIQTQLKTKNLVQGIQKNKEKIDQFLAQHSQNWKISRMDLLDLNILRIAIYEIMFLNKNESSKIFINEAIELAKIYGSVDSSRFVNGILDSIAKTRNIK